MTSFGNNNGPADPTYVYDGEPFTVTPIARPESDGVFDDDIVNHLHDAMTEGLTAAWNGWNAAVQMKSRDLEDYYMRLIQCIVTCRDKVARTGKTRRRLL